MSLNFTWIFFRTNRESFRRPSFILTKVFWTFLLITSPHLLSGQDVVVLRGNIVSADHGKPIPYASVQLQSRSTGTSCNERGEFIFKVPGTFSNDTLVFSSVGYNTLKIPVSYFASFRTIKLQPAVFELKEVTVVGESALDLLKRVITTIPEVYDTTNFHMTAFYRENVRLGDFELNFSEGVLDIFKTFKTNNKDTNDQLAIVKGRKKQIDFSKDPQLYYWISGISNGARYSLGEDMVKYNMGKFSLFNPKNFRYYDFKYGETIKDNDRELIIIEVIPKEKSRKSLFSAKVYIDETSLAVARLDWKLTPAGVRYLERQDKNFGYTIMSTVVGATLDYHAFGVGLSYKSFGDRWYLSSVSRHFEILVSSRKRNMHEVLWQTDMKLQITEIDTANRSPIVQGNIGADKTTFSNLISGEYDEAFWENYNIVKTDVVDSSTSVKWIPDTLTVKGHVPANQPETPYYNAKETFERSDTLRGKLTPLRSCYDVTFYHLEVEVDMDERSIKGRSLMRFDVKQPFRVMQVDLYANMKIGQVLFKNKPLKYIREFDAVFIQLPEMLRDQQAEITIEYEGVPKVPDWSIPMNGGVLWDKDEKGNPWAQVVCQGSGASLWWPNKDHLSDEPDSMKIWITVPADYSEVSNGRLIRKVALPDNKTRYEWAVSYPINNYNATFNIGKYAHYRDYYVTDDSLTLDYYVMDYNLDRARQMFAQVKPMLACYEKYFGKYPFSRDGFSLVESIYPMEHQSGVCIGKITAQNSGSHNPLLWHEAAHEWWGNAISCTDMADMWFHEAFATYAESLVIECEMGRAHAQQFLNEQRSGIGNRYPMIGVRDVNHIYYDIGDMYGKGSLVLNTLRNVLDNDSVWFDLLRAIQDEFRYETLTSDALVAFINQRTKQDYTYFFDQYLKHTSLPALELKIKQSGMDLVIGYRWRADVYGFAMPVKVTTGPDAFDFIHPGPDWQQLIIRNCDEADFEVDEDGFLITVTEITQ